MDFTITFQIKSINFFKSILLLSVVFFSNTVFSQVVINNLEGEYGDYFIVKDVAPTRVAIGSKVVISASQKNTIFAVNKLTGVSCEGVYQHEKTTLTVNGDRSQATFEIVQKTGYPIGNKIKVPLKMYGADGVAKDVYRNSYLPENQIFIDYIAPISKTLSNGSSNNITKITEIFTNYNGFWRSSEYKKDPETLPNTRHELLGFTYDGVIYSTGVDDKLLSDHVPAFTNQVFKAYSTNGVEGETQSQNYLAMADMIDGTMTESITITSPEILGTKVYDVLTDGTNGLDLGTGITNFNQEASIRFYSGNGQPGGLADDVPDLILTQIANPGTADVYYYADEEGNVVGHPIKIKMEANALIAKWRLDLFNLTKKTPYDLAVALDRAYGQNETREIIIAGLHLRDFGITNNASDLKTYIGRINNINMAAGGEADLAFIAYNRASFDIKSPILESAPFSRFVCRIPSTSNVTFNVVAGIDGGANSSDPKEKFTYKWTHYNTVVEEGKEKASYTVEGVTQYKLGTYKLRVSNEYGSLVVPVTLSEGGVPMLWNGADFVPPPVYIAAGLEVADADRSLIFPKDVPANLSNNLEGCDCRVLAGASVTIPKEKTLTLYNNLVVEDVTDIIVDGTTVQTIPAGTLTLENSASLIQIKDDAKNSGKIIVKREAKNVKKNDYVYWSSPVQGGEISMIPGSTSNSFRWEVNFQNKDTKGNWRPIPENKLEVGRGYIKRIKNASNENLAPFNGIPNNGTITHKIYRTDTGQGMTSGMAEGDMHWNLIGNPYPSAISANKFLTANAKDNESIEGGVYIWTHKNEAKKGGSPFYEEFGYNYSADDYKTVNALAATDPDFASFIASGQGFFVKAKVTGDVVFNNAMRFGTDYNNTQFYRSPAQKSTSTSNADEKQLMWLSLSNEDKAATVAVVGYAQGATYGEDILYDATTMGNNEFSLYSEVADKRMAIQGRPLPFDSQDKVPLGVAVPKNGIYKIGIDHLKGSQMLSDELPIFLEDTYNNVIHNLKTAPYGFTATAGDYKDRFVLRYTDRELSVEDQTMSNTFVYIKNSQLFINASNSIEAVTVYDLTGKLLTYYQLDGHSDNFNTNFPFSNGAYLVSLKMDNGQTITKKVIN